TPRKQSPLPSGNADTGVRLAPFLQGVDQLRGLPAHFTHIGQEKVGSALRDLFLGATAQGRIKLMVTTERSEAEGQGRLRWCTDSPSLNGHYQEFKMIWRPKLAFAPEIGAPVEADVAHDVLGSLAYKAPHCGEFRAEQIGCGAMSFEFDGVLDRSCKPRPLL